MISRVERSKSVLRRVGISRCFSIFTKITKTGAYRLQFPEQVLLTSLNTTLSEIKAASLFITEGLSIFEAK
ncbi:hypothetical protein S1OALGB6SA_1305 [Olavius algarvensis spirochete endosymbiont]|nr:hypothetical protein S1OALGB6SA_1305 [Olavius algarvensis spirochete endosymbiont]